MAWLDILGGVLVGVLVFGFLWLTIIVGTYLVLRVTVPGQTGDTYGWVLLGVGGTVAMFGGSLGGIFVLRFLPNVGEAFRFGYVTAVVGVPLLYYGLLILHPIYSGIKYLAGWTYDAVRRWLKSLRRGGEP
jgi:hypothetical protein